MENSSKELVEMQKDFKDGTYVVPVQKSAWEIMQDSHDMVFSEITNLVY